MKYLTVRLNRILPVLLFLTTFCAAAQNVAKEPIDSSVTVAFYARLLQSDSPNAPLVRVLEDGAKLSVLARKGEWLHVSVGKDSGWVLEKNTRSVSRPHPLNTRSA